MNLRMGLIGLALSGSIAFAPLGMARGGGHGSSHGNSSSQSSQGSSQSAQSGQSSSHSGQSSHSHDHDHHGRHHLDPFAYCPWYPGYALGGDYPYIYPPTTEQKQEAEKKVKRYLASVAQGRRRAARSRNIAIETLKPTSKQRAQYATKLAEAKAEAKTRGTKLPQQFVDPDKLRCLMFFDTETKQFVGSGCYMIGSLPAEGGTAKFESVSAEFVGTQDKL